MLKVENIRCGYGNIEVIKGISFDVREGQIVAIIGANGAGKTTTLMAIAGLVPLTGGSIIYEDKDISRIRANELVKLGISQIPEGRQVFPELTVMENLEMGGYIISDKKLKKQRMETVFERFPRLKERSKQVAGTLSGGEQQMLAIGRALMPQPKMLLLDEPSMGLSPKFVGEVFDIIAELKEQGITILLVEQNAGMALECADYAYALQTGEIVAEGTGRDMMQNDEIRKAYLAI